MNLVNTVNGFDLYIGVSVLGDTRYLAIPEDTTAPIYDIGHKNMELVCKRKGITQRDFFPDVPKDQPTPYEIAEKVRASVVSLNNVSTAFLNFGKLLG